MTFPFYAEKTCDHAVSGVIFDAAVFFARRPPAALKTGAKLRKVFNRLPIQPFSQN